MTPLAAISSCLQPDRCETKARAAGNFCLYHDPEGGWAIPAERAAVDMAKTSINDVLGTCFVRQPPSFKTHLDACMHEATMLPPPGPNDVPDQDIVREFVETCIYSFSVLPEYERGADCLKQNVDRVYTAVMTHLDDIRVPKSLMTEDVVKAPTVEQAREMIERAVGSNICESKVIEIRQVLERLDEFV